MVGTLLLLSLTLREDISFSNWQFKTTPFWIQSRDGANLILSPYANARARASQCEFRPGTASRQTLTQWTSIEWTRLLAGRTPSVLNSKPTTFPRGIPGVQMLAKFGTGSSASYLRLIVLNPTGSINAIVYRAEDEVSYQVSSGLLDTLLSTVTFAGAPTASGQIGPDTKPPKAPTDPEKTKPNTPRTEDPGEYKSTPTIGLGSPSPGYDPHSSIDWDGPDVMVRSALDHEPTSNNEIKRDFAASASGLHSSIPAKNLTFDQAMSSVKALFNGADHASTLNALRTNRRAFPSAAELQAAAFQGSLGGNSGFALACLLVIQERTPLDPTALFNMSGILAQIGMPNEALAILGKIDSLGKLPTVAWGYDPKACIAYVRGYSQMLIGKLQEARASLEASVAADPSLSDAKYTLSIVEQAIGRSFKKHLYEGFTRVLNPQAMYCGTMYDDDPSEEVSPANIVIPVPKMFDLSQGKDGALPSMSHPASGQQLLRLTKILPERSKADMAEVTDRAKQEEAIYASYLHPRLTGSPRRMQDRIDQDIFRMIKIDQTRVVELHRLAALISKTDREFNEATLKIQKHIAEEVLAMVKQGLKDEVLKARKRSLYAQAINDVKPFAQAYDLAVRRRYKSWFKYATGVAASVTDPKWREYVDSHIKRQSVLEWMRLYGKVIVLYHACAHVTDDLYTPDASVGPLNPVTHQELGLCNASMKNHKLELKVAKLVSLKMACDKVELEIAEDMAKLEPLGLKVGPFINIGASSKGDLTVYFGAKGSFGTSVGPVDASVTAKSGGYIKVDKSGLKDLGMKVDFSGGATGGEGSLKGTTKIDSMEFSFMPTPPRTSPVRNHGLSLFGGGNP
jgi:hypothetical protein